MQPAHAEITGVEVKEAEPIAEILSLLLQYRYGRNMRTMRSPRTGAVESHIESPSLADSEAAVQDSSPELVDLCPVVIQVESSQGRAKSAILNCSSKRQFICL
jgi:hypothetical protein